MTTSADHRLRIAGIDPAGADILRAAALGAGIAPIKVLEPHSHPCRQCLHDAIPGEQVLLVSYNPFPGDSPYAGPSPIFVHLNPCPEYDGDGVPDQLTRRLLSVRAYDEQHMLRAADVIPGTELSDLAPRLLREPGVAYLQVHNARPGCWAARLTVG